MCGLQRADHGLFVTVCRRHLGGIIGSGRARGKASWEDRARPRQRASLTGNPSAASAVSAISRAIGAASALSGWRRIYGKEEVYGSIP